MGGAGGQSPDPERLKGLAAQLSMGQRACALPKESYLSEAVRGSFEEPASRMLM